MRCSIIHLRVLAACALLLAACAPAARPPPPAPRAPAQTHETWPVPPRSVRMPTGSRFVQSILDADEQGRERAILREISRGNVPNFLRRLVRLDFRAATRSGRTRAVSLWVTPDYLAIGEDADSVRMPMNPITAQLIADRFGFLLPTAKIVDIIYQKARVKLAPRPFPPSARMVHVDEFARHDGVIDAQLGGRAPRGLVAGHKKDLVISNKLASRPHRLAIYGWQKPDSHPIQPLSTAHGDWYADYSHGVRLVRGAMLIDGAPYQVADVLQDPELAPLISDEGPLVRTRYRTEDGVGRARWFPKLRAEDGAKP